MSRSTTINVSLPPSLRKFVQQQVKSGRYHSGSEVLRDAIRRLILDAEAEAGRRSIQSGGVIDGESYFEQLEKAPRKRRKRSA